MTVENFAEQKQSSVAFLDGSICGFWSRIFALLIDIILLGIIGFIVGWLLFDQLAQLGKWGRLIGLVFAISYFGLLNSHIGKGQSIGKKLLQIRVTDKNGQDISLPRSLIRATILATPYFIGPIISPEFSSMNFPAILGNLIILALALGLIYFYLFNRTTRQSLHDLIVGTYVVDNTAKGKISVGSPARVHYIIFSISFLILSNLTIWISKQETFSNIQVVQQNLKQIKGISSPDFKKSIKFGRHNDNEKFKAEITLLEEPQSFEPLILECAKIILDSYPQFTSKDMITIEINYGFDLGIATFYKSRSSAHTIEEWKNLLATISS